MIPVNQNKLQGIIIHSQPQKATADAGVPTNLKKTYKNTRGHKMMRDDSLESRLLCINFVGDSS
jgi:hypothetical protein